jgi:hypothetical protein
MYDNNLLKKSSILWLPIRACGRNFKNFNLFSKFGQLNF